MMFLKNRGPGNEQGFVMVVSLVFLGILGLLGATAVIVTTTDLRIGGNYRNSVQAYYAAEAGIKEMVGRLNLATYDTHRIGEAPGAPPTPGWGTYIVMQTGAQQFKEDPDWNLSTDGLDNDGDGTTDEANETYPEVATMQSLDGSEVPFLLKIHYKLEDAQYNNGTANNEVVLFGQDFGYGSSAPATGILPVMVIVSTGRGSGGARRTLVAEVKRLAPGVYAKAALTCDDMPHLGGNTFVSGFNHAVSTSPGDGAESTTDMTGNDLPLDGNGMDNHGGPEKFTGFNGSDTNTTLISDEDTVQSSPGKSNEYSIPYGARILSNPALYRPGVWTTGDTVVQWGTDDIYGGNAVEPWKDEGAGNTWWTLDQVLGLSPSEAAAVLANADVTISDTVTTGGAVRLSKPPQGIIYIDNGPTGKELKITGSTPSYDDGWGLLYVTGDLDAQTLEFKGLIYVEGTIKLSGNFWVLGALMVKGGNPSGTGGADILYSKEALEQKIGDAMKFAILSVGDESLL